MLDSTMSACAPARMPLRRTPTSHIARRWLQHTGRPTVEMGFTRSASCSLLSSLSWSQHHCCRPESLGEDPRPTDQKCVHLDQCRTPVPPRHAGALLESSVAGGPNEQLQGRRPVGTATTSSSSNSPVATARCRPPPSGSRRMAARRRPPTAPASCAAGSSATGARRKRMRSCRAASLRAARPPSRAPRKPFALLHRFPAEASAAVVPQPDWGVEAAQARRPRGRRACMR